jgi:carbamoyltransferase
MLILGLNDSNSAAAIIRDGVLLAAAREERFSRIKFDDAFPHQAIDYCLQEAGAGSLKDVDHVVFAWNPGHEIEPHDTSSAVRYHKHFLHYVPNNLLAHVGGVKEHKRVAAIRQTIDFADGASLPISFLPHHACHAASAFLVSPFDEAACLTIDAYGDDVTTELFHGIGNSLKSVRRTLFPHSMGEVYAAVTQHLGFRANSDEWKVMGLAPYGDPARYYEDFSRLIRFDRERGELRIDLDFFTYYTWSPRRFSNQFVERFGPERHPEDDLNDRHRDIAASCQRRVEDVVLEMCRYLHEETGSGNLCLAGGVAMNSKMNGRLLAEGPFDALWIQPSADDAGGSIGACFYQWNQVLGNERLFLMEHDCWGPGFTDAEIEQALKDSQLPYKRVDEIERIAAGLVARGDILGWFQGRMEMGQRALGHRSLIADPRDAGIKAKINRAVKHREAYRPFAPSILEKYAGEYFGVDHDNPFMQMVLDIRSEKRAVIPAVTHCDGTGRSQTVSRRTSPRFWKLIDEFRRLTSVPVVLNTSFNDNEEPIVCTPKDAIRCYCSTGIDHLGMGPFLLSKEPVAQNA